MPPGTPYFYVAYRVAVGNCVWEKSGLRGVKPLSRRYRSAAPLVGEPLAWRCVFESERFATACPAGARQNEVSLMSITNLPYDPRMRERVQELRHKMTPMEKKLWYSFLRTYPVKMYKQRPIRTFVADFYCPWQDWVLNLTAHSIILNRE